MSNWLVIWHISSIFFSHYTSYHMWFLLIHTIHYSMMFYRIWLWLFFVRRFIQELTIIVHLVVVDNYVYTFPFPLFSLFLHEFISYLCYNSIYYTLIFCRSFWSSVSFYQLSLEQDECINHYVLYRIYLVLSILIILLRNQVYFFYWLFIAGIYVIIFYLIIKGLQFIIQ